MAAVPLAEPKAAAPALQRRAPAATRQLRRRETIEQPKTCRAARQCRGARLVTEGFLMNLWSDSFFCTVHALVLFALNSVNCSLSILT
jgi:hypothetical protein